MVCVKPSKSQISPAVPPTFSISLVLRRWSRLLNVLSYHPPGVMWRNLKAGTYSPLPVSSLEILLRSFDECNDYTRLGGFTRTTNCCSDYRLTTTVAYIHPPPRTRRSLYPRAHFLRTSRCSGAASAHNDNLSLLTCCTTYITKGSESLSSTS